jgi:uncharacterized protein YbaA (DUF1428 family)
MPYVDGYVIPLPKKNLPTYIRIARKASKVFIEHGALKYTECVGDDLEPTWALPFTKALKTKPSETVVFSWVVYKSKAHRNQVNAKVMKDPRLASMMDPKNMPFDPKRMLYGGFKTVVYL